MGKELYKPDNMTWEEWMCELMCGSPEDIDEDDEDDRTDKATSTDA